MLLPRYELKSRESLMIFEFISVGIKGKIIKTIQYSETNLKGFYNLGFGDKGLQTGEINEMKKIEELNKSKSSVVRIDKSLDKYKDKVLFKEQVKKANETLKSVGLPRTLEKPKA